MYYNTVIYQFRFLVFYLCLCFMDTLCFRQLPFFSSNENNLKRSQLYSTPLFPVQWWDNWKKNDAPTFKYAYSLLQAKLTYSVMLWTQASRVIQTVKRPVHSLTHWLTHSHIQINSSSTTIPCQDVLPLFSSFHVLSDSLFASYLRPSVASPCAVLEGMALKVVWTELDRPVLLPAGQFYWWVTEPDPQQVFKERNTQLNIQCFSYHLWDVLLVCVLEEENMYVSVYVSWVTAVKTSCLVDVVSGC